MQSVDAPAAGFGAQLKEAEMNMPIGTLGRGRKLAVLLMVLSLLAVATPAAADHGIAGTGEAAGSGEEVVFQHEDPAGLPLCLKVTASKYRVDMVGTFTAADPDGAAVHAGGAQLEYEAKDYWINAAGTFRDAQCTDPRPVDAHAQVKQFPPGPGSITCDRVPAQYSRVNTTVTVTWTASCTVNGTLGDSAHTPADTQHVFVGNLVPCADDPVTQTNTCDDVAGDAQLTGEWTYAGGDAP